MTNIRMPGSQPPVSAAAAPHQPPGAAAEPKPSDRTAMLVGTLLLILLAAAMALHLVPSDTSVRLVELFGCLTLGVLAHFMIGSIAVGKKILGLDVTAAGGPAVFLLAYGTFFLVGSGVTPVTIDATPGGSRVTVTAGDTAPTGRARVTLRGNGADSVRWYAMHQRGWIAPERGPFTGSRELTWRRDVRSYRPGKYVDTLYVWAPPGRTASVVDTVEVVGKR